MNKYKQHQVFLKKVMLHVQSEFPESRMWEIATGQAYALFSVKSAIKVAIQTRNVAQAMKILIRVVYGKKGHPDITGLLYGIWIGIEIKTGSAVQSQDQKFFEEMINAAGGVYITVSNSSEIAPQLTRLYKIRENVELIKTMTK